jgi:hypothetical protein
LEAGSKLLMVFYAVREDQDVPPASLRLGYVRADLFGPLLVGRDADQHDLDGCAIVGVGFSDGVVHDQVTADEHGGRRVKRHGVTNRPEVHVEYGFEAVPVDEAWR